MTNDVIFLVASFFITYILFSGFDTWQYIKLRKRVEKLEENIKK